MIIIINKFNNAIANNIEIVYFVTVVTYVVNNSTVIVVMIGQK